MSPDLAIDSFKYSNEEKWFEVLLKCTKFPSVNSMYGINTSTGAVFKDSATSRFENELKDQIAYCDPKSHCDWIEPNIPYGWNMDFLFGASFWSRDVSNMVKSPEDVIFRSLNLNDARVVEGRMRKFYVPGRWEYLIVRVYTRDFNVNYFYD